MEIAYVSSYDPRNRREWSGLGYGIMQCLSEQGLHVTPFGPLKGRLNIVGRLKGRWYRHALHQSYEFERSALVGWDYAFQIKRKLKRGTFDVVFSPGAPQVSRLRCSQPIVLWADATFQSLISHYSQYKTLAKETIKAGHRADALAYANCSLAIFASQWAADSAIRDYGVDPHKVKVVPFGANFVRVPSAAVALESAMSRDSKRCNLVTIGVDWVRKGVPRAIALTAELNRRGLLTTLTVVGCTPPAGERVPPYVKIAGFIDKRSADGEATLTTLLSGAHFHVLFSIGEAYGLVFAEANAHAVPNIASDAGGIPTVVVNGRGGQRFPADASVESIADYVLALMSNPGLYLDLAQRARAEFDERLNWRVAGTAIRELLVGLQKTQMGK